MLVCSICSKEGPDEQHKEAVRWDWFTGYLKKRFVVCPQCRQDCQLEVIRAKQESQCKPTGQSTPTQETP